MDLNIKLEVNSNIEEYKDLLLKAERQIRELKETFKKMDGFKLQFEIKDNLPCVVCGKPSKKGELCSNECADKYREEDRLRRMDKEEEKENIEKSLEVNQKEKTTFKCFKCGEIFNIEYLYAILPYDRGGGDLCGDCYSYWCKTNFPAPKDLKESEYHCQNCNHVFTKEDNKIPKNCLNCNYGLEKIYI